MSARNVLSSEIMGVPRTFGIRVMGIVEIRDGVYEESIYIKHSLEDSSQSRYLTNDGEF